MVKDGDNQKDHFNKNCSNKDGKLDVEVESDETRAT